ncbi:MAG TPA: hypothetical protein VGN72_19835 [Tepidisphaeraceae bacterium]|jgi:hypothetical protein|nr:hypothetical protein [Tepidisphaeraceae bacterium]
MPLAEGKTEESVKINAADYDRAENIALDTGLSRKDSIGAALEGWDSLPRTVRERIRRDRLARAAARDGRQGRTERVSA